MKTAKARFYAKHREELRAEARAYYWKNIERCRAKARERARTARAKELKRRWRNSDAGRASNRRYYATHTEQRRAIWRRWYEKNGASSAEARRDRIREAGRRHYRKHHESRRAWATANPGVVREIKRRSADKHRATRSAKQRERYAKDSSYRSSVGARNKSWQKHNRLACREHLTRTRLRRKGIPETYVRDLARLVALKNLLKKGLR